MTRTNTAAYPDAAVIREDDPPRGRFPSGVTGRESRSLQGRAANLAVLRRIGRRGPNTPGVSENGGRRRRGRGPAKPGRAAKNAKNGLSRRRGRGPAKPGRAAKNAKRASLLRLIRVHRPDPGGPLRPLPRVRTRRPGPIQVGIAALCGRRPARRSRSGCRQRALRWRAACRGAYPYSCRRMRVFMGGKGGERPARAAPVACGRRPMPRERRQLGGSRRARRLSRPPGRVQHRSTRWVRGGRGGRRAVRRCRRWLRWTARSRCWPRNRGDIP